MRSCWTALTSCLRKWVNEAYMRCFTSITPGSGRVDIPSIWNGPAKARFLPARRGLGQVSRLREPVRQEYGGDGYVQSPCPVYHIPHDRYTGKPYSEDKAIMSWQVGNEPRAFGDDNKDAFAGWMREVTALIRSLDPQPPDQFGFGGEQGFGKRYRALAQGA